MASTGPTASVREVNTSPLTCDQCGATTVDGASCRDRFDALLALDHSRTEPWGSRHGLAFAVFTLQHSGGASHEMVERCLEILRRVYHRGEDRHHVFSTTRSNHAIVLASSPCQMPPIAPSAFAFTIGDMHDFSADTYVADLESWSRATLDAWSVD